MNSAFSYLAMGAAYGFAAAMQPGPFQAYLVAQTMNSGWRRTWPIIFAPLLSDVPIVTLVLLVLSRIPAWWLQVLRIVGGVFVLYLAVGVLKAWRDFKPQAEPASQSRQTIFRAALVNLLNPNPYIFWSLVAGPILLTGWRLSPINGLGLMIGFYGALLAGMVVILLLCTGAGRLGARINRALLGFSGLALAGFGLYQIWSGLAAWLY